jgi:PAS domain S-box-containing protein
MQSDLLFDETPEKAETGLRHLQTRYVAPYVACVFAAVLITGLALGFKGRWMLIDRVKSEQLTQARAGAQAVGSYAESALRFAESVSQSSIAKGQDLGAVGILLRAQAQLNGRVSAIYLFSNKGNLLASSQAGDGMAPALLEDPCYGKIKSGDTRCFTAMMRLDGGDRRAYVFTPVFNSSGGVMRVLAAEMDLEDKGFNSIVAGLNPGEKGFSYLVDGRGRLVATGDSSRDNSVREVSKLAPVKAALANQTGSVEYRYGRVSMLASFSPVEPCGWGFIVQRPAGEAGLGSGSLFKLLFLFIVIASGAAAGLAVFQVQSVTRFLFFLSARMDAVARGHSQSEIDLGETAGFSHLTAAFNRMVEAMEERRRDFSKDLDGVRETARFNQGILSSIKDLFVVVDRFQVVSVANEKAESYMPAGMRPSAGRALGSLGQAWGQSRVTDAAKKAIETMQVVSVSTVKFPPLEGSGAAIFDFRIYPLTTGAGGVVFYGREVSEFVSRHEKMRESEAFYRSVTTDVGDALVVLDHENKVEWMNPAAARMLGVQDDFLGADWSVCVDAKSRAAFFEELRRAAEEDSPSAPMEIGVVIGERELAVEVVAGVIHLSAGATKSVLTMRRVDSRRGCERNALSERPLLEKRIKFLAAVFESLPDEIAVVNEQGQLLMVNSAFAGRFEERKEVFIGKKFDVLSAGGGPVMDMAILDRQGSMRKETMMRSLRGKTFHAEVLGAAIRNDNGNKGYIFSIREIGREREANAREARKLEARTRTRMARTIADRFERILDSLTSEVKELGGNLFAPETRAIWENILKSCKDLSLAANSLMMYSVDNPVQLSACGVNQIIKDTVTALAGKGMIPPNVHVEIQPDRFCPPLSADADLLKMAVWHLTLNAVQAGALNEETGEILVRSYQAEVEGAPVVIFEVLDNGPEYDPAETAHFFEPFYGTKPGSMGLGLTLTRRVILKHGGRIGIERANGLTRASFLIPLELSRGTLPRV